MQVPPLTSTLEIGDHTRKRRTRQLGQNSIGTFGTHRGAEEKFSSIAKWYQQGEAIAVHLRAPHKPRHQQYGKFENKWNNYEKNGGRFGGLEATTRGEHAMINRRKRESQSPTYNPAPTSVAPTTTISTSLPIPTHPCRDIYSGKSHLTLLL